MTLHFRGFPDFTTDEWTPICSTPEARIRGEVTTEPTRVSCNSCRRVLKMNPALDIPEDESERRYP